MVGKTAGRAVRREAGAVSTLRRGTVLVTRPVGEARKFARALRRQGFSTLTDPMLEIAHLQGPAPDLSGIQGLVFTSANGVRAFAERSESRNIAVWAVGEATVRAATAAGFSRIGIAPFPNLQSLSELVAREADPEDGALLHLSGRKTAGDRAALPAAGFRLERLVVYDARPARRLGTRTRYAIDRGDLRCVAFFSPRTAGIFARLVREAGCVDACGRIDAVCISPAAAAAAREVNWARVLVAARPGSEAMLAKMDEAL